MELKNVKVSELIPYDNNPRNNKKAVGAVKESIKQVGYVAPIIVDEDMVLLAGHTRLEAIKQMGETEVKVLVAEGLNEEQKKKYRILDNKTSEFAEWDFAKLEVELEGLDFGDFDFGFDDGEKIESDPKGNFEESDFEYENQYGVTVLLADEAEQERCYNELTAMGYICKVVTV